MCVHAERERLATMRTHFLLYVRPLIIQTYLLWPPNECPHELNKRHAVVRLRELELSSRKWITHPHTRGGFRFSFIWWHYICQKCMCTNQNSPENIAVWSWFLKWSGFTHIYGCWHSRVSFAGPNGGHQFRALGLGQRPFLDAPFTSHLRDLETFRRKAPLTPISGNHPTTNGISPDCQGYKPNAPQVHGKLKELFFVDI